MASLDTTCEDDHGDYEKGVDVQARATMRVVEATRTAEKRPM
jgi:hypothetical protein